MMLNILYHIIFYLERFTEDDAQKELVFDDKDKVWVEMKHQHLYHAVE